MDGNVQVIQVFMPGGIFAALVAILMIGYLLRHSQHHEVRTFAALSGRRKTHSGSADTIDCP